MLLKHTFLPLVAVAATALSTTTLASALPSRSNDDAVVARAQPAEELHTAPGTGNLIWSSDDDDSNDKIPSLGRPDFSKAFQHFDTTFDQVEGSLQHLLEQMKEGVMHSVEDAVDSAHKMANGWVHEAKVMVKGQEFNKLTHPQFPSYALRVSTTSNTTACDPNVKQFSGYLDISETKHLWFVFFEARNNPEKAPLSLWLNGGPGCSSSTGLLFELGPCRIANEGKNVVNNPHSWTNNANMIFLDQPVNVGYSYSENGDDVNNTPAAAEDVYAFLQLFLQKYSQYAKKPFHIAGESYGGTYIPHMASVIHKNNKQLSKQADSSRVHINLESIAIGNGLTEPKTQFASIPEFACSTENPYAIFKNGSSTCLALEQKAKTCESLIDSCYKYNNRLTCLPASLYCWSNLYGPAQNAGLNLYDVRQKCDREKDGSLCYKEMDWIETYMNSPEVRKAWGADESVKFASCNLEINKGFLFQGDGMHDNSLVLPELINDGIRVIVYAGRTDFMVNWMGVSRFFENLETKYTKEYQSASIQKWNHNGKEAGWGKVAGNGHVAFVNFADSGHMVPMNAPEPALVMWEAWLKNKEFLKE
ncbi:unnamed protein product [Sympodiomycopsis kandeliae]